LKITKNIHGWLVAAAFLATVAILFGGQAINAKVRVENPVNQHLNAMKAVTKFKVNPAGNGLQLYLKLKQSPNLQQVLNAAIKEVEFYHKKPVTEIVIGSHSNPQLEQICYQLSFNLEEALASGHFIQLQTALAAYNRPGMMAKVYLDRQFIYLQLEAGKNYLYQAVPRPDRTVTSVSAANRTEGRTLE
jgi:predicted RND superfamily exporter protein